MWCCCKPSSQWHHGPIWKQWYTRWKATDNIFIQVKESLDVWNELPFLYIKIRLYRTNSIFNVLDLLYSNRLPAPCFPTKFPVPLDYFTSYVSEHETVRGLSKRQRILWFFLKYPRCNSPPLFPAFIWIRNNWVGASQSNTHQPIKTSLCETTEDLYRPMHGANWDVEQTTSLTMFSHKFPYTMFSFKVPYTLFSTRLPGSTLRLSHRHQIGCSHMSLWRHKAGWHVISNVGKHRLPTPWHNLFDWDKVAEINWDRKDTIHQLIQTFLSEQSQMQSFNFAKMTFPF